MPETNPSQSVFPPFITDSIKLVVSIILLLVIGYITFKYSYTCVEPFSFRDIYCELQEEIQEDPSGSASADDAAAAAGAVDAAAGAVDAGAVDAGADGASAGAESEDQTTDPVSTTSDVSDVSDILTDENCSLNPVRFTVLCLVLVLPTLKIISILNSSTKGAMGAAGAATRSVGAKAVNVTKTAGKKISDKTSEIASSVAGAFKEIFSGFKSGIVKGIYKILGNLSPILLIVLALYFVVYPIIRWFLLNFSCELSPTEVAQQEQLNFQETVGDFEMGNLTITIVDNTQDDSVSKYLPGQVMHINDTVSQETLSVQIPEPSGYITEFNNFLRTPNNQLPIIRAPLEQQADDSEEDPHNRVYRTGVQEGSIVSPCSRIELNVDTRNILQNNYSSVPITDNLLNLSINEYELIRQECAGHSGQCYMDEYPCQTALGVPIPLKHMDGGLTYPTVGELSDIGCQKATYPCDTEGESCVSLGLDSSIDTATSGHLIEVDGTCQSVIWSSDDWVQDSSTESSLHCIPNSGESLTGATFQDSLSPQCRSIERIPQLEYTGPGPKYTWSYDASTGFSLCTTPNLSVSWTGECDTGLEPVSGLVSYPDPSTLETIQSLCCVEPITEERGTFVVTTDYEES